MSVTAAAGVIVTPPPWHLPPVTERYQRLQHPILITMVTIALLPLAPLKGLAAAATSAGLDQTNNKQQNTPTFHHLQVSLRRSMYLSVTVLL